MKIGARSAGVTFCALATVVVGVSAIMARERFVQVTLAITAVLVVLAGVRAYRTPVVPFAERRAQTIAIWAGLGVLAAVTLGAWLVVL